MNAGQITYNHGTIDALVSEVSQASVQLRTGLDDLKQYLQPLVAEWQGSAAEAYQVHQQQWDQAAAALQAMLTEISNAALRGNQGMADADRTAANGWG
ncbi:ESAT-6-like protein [Dietzia sp. NCCP-2495]|uniref:WXG100 family type VII secretion target n=1 Tax=Dietzia sp. NCCP-2495 TaxID=2934675 RepID=UPI0016A73897|nr:WXG100 family type VII secretion target [Dietzia sp. NCCP-2495]NLD85671.1 WXG100 family type VII secretion target [Actinomycetales bacterium]GLB64687.1 ESAT-6-like protein [Dietzia sp. NCCP-2495]